MSSDQRSRLVRAVQQRKLQLSMKEQGTKPDALGEWERKLLKEDLSDLAPMVDQLNAFEKRRITDLKPSLNLQDVQIDGYLLPLTQSNRKVTEFLLVPIVGACIHVPPPPPNQMIVVRYPQGYEQGELFAPVTIRGKLRVGHSKSNLSLVDGAAMVESGYQMSADAVTAYKK
ncbi:DUF3299 domain-containing protein [Jeongeupia naejangsanensis]|uniref:DUF3299 domain-containing protein n=1 Tax=Jeongeupia naejangsanensis TaxID=613195 RepID=A0ABS2BLK4_9NEIS|nr:DUF3299 domain-containing protein [Jeongeupia naejangsanensis]MBM3116320.1 DUF3299 domain-containing protein [Jeongeupia naejangsanensis]